MINIIRVNTFHGLLMKRRDVEHHFLPRLQGHEEMLAPREPLPIASIECTESQERLGPLSDQLHTQLFGPLSMKDLRRVVSESH